MPEWAKGGGGGGGGASGDGGGEEDMYQAGKGRRGLKGLGKIKVGSSVERDLRRLAALVWEGGADDTQRFIQIALSDDPFPI